MANYCEAALITCEDFRLHQRVDGRNYIADFISGLNRDCDLITRGGGVKDLVRPKMEGYTNSLFRDTQVSVKLHNAQTIYLINHEDCGAYKDMDFSSKQEEKDQHCKDLRKAKEMILERFPKKEVEIYFGELIEGSCDKLEINKLK